jgi:hypothetical protein
MQSKDAVEPFRCDFDEMKIDRRDDSVRKHVITGSRLMTRLATFTADGSEGRHDDTLDYRRSASAA